MCCVFSAVDLTGVEVINNSTNRGSLIKKIDDMKKGSQNTNNVEKRRAYRRVIGY